MQGIGDYRQRKTRYSLRLMT